MYHSSRFICLRVMLLGSLMLFAQSARSQEGVTRQSYCASTIPLSEFNFSDSKAPMVRLSIGGRGYWFLMDTGSSASYIKRSLVKEAKLSEEENIPPVTKDSFNLEKRLLIDGKLRGVRVDVIVGSVELPSIPFYQAPDVVLGELLMQDASIGGIVGANFLKKFAVAFDFDRNEITLIPEGNLTMSHLKSLGYADGSTVSLYNLPEAKNAYFVDALHNDKRLSLILDTGSSSTILQLAKSGVSPTNPPSSNSTIATIYGKRQMVSKNGSISVGSLKMDSTRLLSPADGENISEIGDGVLGLDFLSRYRVLIDFPAKKMYFLPRKTKDRIAKQTL